MSVRVVVSGAAGRMGQETCRAVASDPALELVGAVDVVQSGRSLADLVGGGVPGLPMRGDLVAVVRDTQAQVVVDFSVPESRMKVFSAAIAAGARPVVGTTGWTEADIAACRTLCQRHGLGAIIAPNFSIGAVLMMKFAAQAARYMPSVEIIELHHNQKLDAPSGTAVKTAALIAAARGDREPGEPHPARGQEFHGVPIHSVRLPGLLAHQQVIFGGLGQTLTLVHDSLSRESFMPGVILACKRVLELNELVYGLENLL
ncbi:MAG TPA: 4-hydroxy-tetrahydrodipicolinate reductase [Armatimonadota bacterium]|nr:4-hydroxy-tetrahydrodipicolinate reductase [Armatimonadota bacterium]HQK94938.1 4-hydroxy-tetrahydrodipicolinate reductase [Armatimonadota bacterium]